MDFGILGPLQVVHDGAVLDLGRTQQRMLLARLLVAGGHPVSVDRLADDLWGDHPPLRAALSLQALVSRLRRVLEPDRAPRDLARVLVTRAPGYALDVAPEAVDAVRFARLAAEGSAALAGGDPVAALRLLDQALALWRGDVLADLGDLDFVRGAAASHDELRASALAERAAALLATGATAHALAALEALTREQPLRERPWELLLTALHRAGRTAEALDRFRGLRTHFADQLGLDPGPRLQAMEAALLRGDLPATSVVPTASAVAANRPSTPSVAADGEAVLGRARELDLIEAAVTQALAGATRWVVVSGEAGIGKTRLAEHAAAVASRHGAAVVWGRAHEDGAAPALWPWVQVLRALPGVDDPGAVLRAPVDAEGDIAAERFERADRVAATLAASAAERPLLVVLDDLQWFDPESLRLVAHLGLHVRDVGLAVVATVRAGATTAEVDRVVTDVARRPGAMRIDLAGLDLAATGALARTVRGEDLVPDEIATLHERTAGNPYFVTEFVRLGRDAIAAEAVPDGVRDVLRRRVGPLPDRVRSLLSLAAIAGGEVALDLLAAASGRDRAEVVEDLGAAVDAHVLRTMGAPGRYQFAHALLRSTLRDDVPDLERRRLHLRLADALRGPATTDPDRWLPERASHLAAAAPLGDASETADACVAAADLAERRLAHEDAVRWREQALRVIDSDQALAADRTSRLAALTQLGHARGRASDHMGALTTLAEAIDVAEDLGDAAAMARAVQGFDLSGGVWFWVPQGTRPAALIERIDHTLAALGDADTAERARVLVVRSAGEYYGDQELGIRLATEAVAIAGRIGDPMLMVEALAGSLQIGWRPQAMVHQWEQATQLLELALSLGSRHHELLARTRLFTTALSFGDVAAAERHHGDALALARDMRRTLVEAQLMWSVAMFHTLRGEMAQAHRVAHEAESLHRRTGLYAIERAAGQTVGMLAWEQGRLHALPPERRALVLEGFAEATVADHHRAGRSDEARAVLADLAAVPLLPSYEWLGLTNVHARLAADLGDVEFARRLHAALLPYRGHFGHFGTVACAGPVDVPLGRLASLLGDHDAAVDGLGASVATMDARRLPVWGVRAREALAVALRRRAAPTDLERAHTVLGEAATLADRIGVALEPHVGEVPTGV